jgi:hypothetical protein
MKHALILTAFFLVIAAILVAGCTTVPAQIMTNGLVHAVEYR